MTKEEALDIIYRSNKDWDFIEEQIVDRGRWSIRYRQIHQHQDKYYEVYFSRGATEQQDEGPFEYEDPEFTEVEKVEVVKHEWRPVHSS